MITLANSVGSTKYTLDVEVFPDENSNSAPYFDAEDWE